MLSRNSRLWPSALLVIAACSISSHAAELFLHLDYVGSLKSDEITPTDYLLTDSSFGPVDPTDLHHFQVSFSLEGATDAPDESLQAIIFDVALGQGVTPVLYSPNPVNPIYDPPPPGLGGGGPNNLWNENLDSGPSDLRRITFITSRAQAHGLDPGEASPFYFGDFWVKWNTDVSPVLSLELRPAINTLDPWSLWVGPSNFSIGGPETLHGESFTAVLPEPASGALALVAALGMLGLARRR